ncbi:MAG: hypothetical protein KDC14_18535, partial [Planctomycetes bacterium]|nr:hypothetical protein [Planctomycetota bacterium]
MSEIERNTPDGRWRIFGWRQAEMEAAARLGSRLARDDRVVGEFREFGDERVYLKGSPLARRPALRHTLRQLLLRVPPPRLAEYMNLSWMTERHFQCPLPLAGGALWRGGRPCYQFLITREVPDAVGMREFLSRPDERRHEVLAEFARELARLHALRFVHRDLYPRNLLVVPPRAGRSVVFLDAWRGGERLQSRGYAHDLGCFFLSAAEWLDPAEQSAFLATYAAERAAQARPVTAGWLEDVVRA